MNESETHFASFVVQADPCKIDAVSKTLVSKVGMLVHADDPSGKIIVTAETQNQSEVVDCLEFIQTVRGVFGANLVYHHFENTALLNEIME